VSFTRAHPCPVCDGFDGAPRGAGIRCYGRLSDDGAWAFCTREERAGGLRRHESSGTYVHWLAGPCRCGTIHGDPDTSRDRPTGGAGTIIALYDYHEADGTFLFQVVRRAPKEFRQRRPRRSTDDTAALRLHGTGFDDEWVWSLKRLEPTPGTSCKECGGAHREEPAVRPVLYRLPELLGADASEPVWVTEGEKDVHALVALGLVATTNPGGAGKWRAEYGDALRGRHVIVAGDNDDRGRSHVAQVVAALTGVAASVRVVAVPAPAKDVAEWLATGHTADDLRALVAAADPAPPAAGVLLSEVRPEAVDWLWYPRLPRAKLVLLTGAPDEGKTTVALDLAARVSRGAAMPGGIGARPPAGVVVLSAEDGLADTIVPRLLAAGADLARIASCRLDDLPTLDDDGLAFIRALIARVAARLLVIDPLMAFVPDALDTHRDHHSRRLLRKLSGLAEDTGATVVVLRHLRKGASGSAKDAGGGSIGFTGAARVELLAAPDPDDDGRKVLAKIKNNLTPPFPALGYRLVGALDGATVRVEWLGETSHTADALLNTPVDDDDRAALAEAEAFLRAELEGGERPAKDVIAAAGKMRIAERTLNRAKARVGVVSQKRGFGQDGEWFWALRAAAGPKGCQDPKDGQGPDAGNLKGSGNLRERRPDDPSPAGNGAAPADDGFEEGAL
jgi:hypothetical protein